MDKWNILCDVPIPIQIPQYLHEAGWTANGYTVGVTQPRRVAATTVCGAYCPRW